MPLIVEAAVCAGAASSARILVAVGVGATRARQAGGHASARCIGVERNAESGFLINTAGLAERWVSGFVRHASAVAFVERHGALGAGGDGGGSTVSASSSETIIGGGTSMEASGHGLALVVPGGGVAGAVGAGGAGGANLIICATIIGADILKVASRAAGDRGAMRPRRSSLRCIQPRRPTCQQTQPAGRPAAAQPRACT